MPNHVTSVVTVTGPAAHVAAFVEAHIVPTSSDARRFFDLGTVIPKPASVGDTQSGSQAEVGLYALHGIHPDRRFFPPAGDRVCELFPFLPRTVTTREELVAHLRERDPEALEWGAKAKRCLDETGFVDWYAWSVAKWGTKWNAYDFEERERGDGRYVFKFETAWSFPEPIFRELAERWPSLVFACMSYDEGDCFGAEGEFNGRNDWRAAKELATDELYARVYGEPRPKDEDDG